MIQSFTEFVVEDAAQRDTLLPKLISGELRIQDANRVIDRATA
jgi:hypothetical protein